MIDVHTHYMPRGVEAFDAPGCPRLVIESPTCGQLYTGDVHYRTIDERSWDADRRIADMDAREVALQVLSPIPVTNGYVAAPAAGLAYARLHNDGIAELVRARPDRFAGLGGVPLQDVDAACAELTRLITELGLHGVELATNVAGAELDDPRFDPFWERCDALRAIVFIHPETAPGFGRLRAHNLVTSTGYPSETGLIAARLLMNGFLERFPEVRIVLAHGGGTLPWLLPRLDRLWAFTPALRAARTEAPSVTARRFFCDTLVYDSDNLGLCVRRFGADRLMVGTDYPFAIAEDPPGEVLAETPLDAAVREALRDGNARRLLAR